jgi:cytochrome c oxidase subunit 2
LLSNSLLRLQRCLGFVLACTSLLIMAFVPALLKAAEPSAYAVCASCHGLQGEGNVALNAPRIAGQAGWYLRRQLDAYRQGLRGTAPGDTYGMQMRSMVMTLTQPAQVDDVVAHLESLPNVPAEPTIRGDVASGQAAYSICVSCHGPRGEGNEQLGGPRLAGQSDWYLVRQIRNYRQGLRGYDSEDLFGMQMKPMAATLADDQAIVDVVAYINSLR